MGMVRLTVNRESHNAYLINYPKLIKPYKPYIKDYLPKSILKELSHILFCFTEYKVEDDNQYRWIVTKYRWEW